MFVPKCDGVSDLSKMSHNLKLFDLYTSAGVDSDRLVGHVTWMGEMRMLT